MRSIQPSHPGALESIFTIYYFVQPEMPGDRQIRNKMASRSAGLKYLGLSSRPQDRYIVARRSPRSMACGLPSAVRLETFQGVPSCDGRPHDVNKKWRLAGPPA